MIPEFIRISPLWGPLFAIGVFGSLLLLASVVSLGTRAVLNHRTDPDPLDDHVPLDILLLTTLRGPLVFFISVMGLLLGFIVLTELTHPAFDVLDGLNEWTRRAWGILVIAAASYLASHLAYFVLDWYVKAYAARTDTNLDNAVLPPLKRVIPLIIYSIGALVALNSLGISISPILAGAGIGGLAVALAVTPTLGNFFAGTYLMAERELTKDDYIALDQGPSGYVVEVGWRSTKIRTFYNTMVIIPNSKLADTVITNFYRPDDGMFIMLTGGVSYENDLTHVRQVVVDEIQKLVDESPHAVKEYKPWFGYEKFDDSNVEFWIYYEAKNLMGSFYLKSDGIERLHARFKEEGIKRNYPVRELIYPSTDGQPNLSRPRNMHVHEQSVQ